MTIAADIALYDVVVVGGGAAGVGISIALKHAGIENYLVLERDAVGASFAAWPDETCFITPSFPSNSIGILDFYFAACVFRLYFHSFLHVQKCRLHRISIPK